MRRQRNRRLNAEELESRMTPVGFYEGPASAPIVLALQGVAQGYATVHNPAFRPHAHPATPSSSTHINASGVITPIGRAVISGSFFGTSAGELGTLSVKSARSNVTLRLIQTSPSSSTFTFNIMDGRGSIPGDLAYAPEQGSGTVDVTLPEGPGKTPISLVFHSP